MDVSTSRTQRSPQPSAVSTYPIQMIQWYLPVLVAMTLAIAAQGTTVAV